MSAPCPALGFVVTMTRRPNIGEADVDVLIDAFIDVLESHGLQTGGVGDTTLEFVVSREGGQATDVDRTVVREWAAQWTAQANIVVGDIVDLSDGR
jgi:uncharacterized protein YggL (DUF469 family)